MIVELSGHVIVDVDVVGDVNGDGRGVGIGWTRRAKRITGIESRELPAHA